MQPKNLTPFSVKYDVKFEKFKSVNEKPDLRKEFVQLSRSD